MSSAGPHGMSLPTVLFYRDKRFYETKKIMSTEAKTELKKNGETLILWNSSHLLSRRV